MDKEKEQLEESTDNQESVMEMDSPESIDPVIQLEADLAETKDKYLRLVAEFDNYKKRTVKERLDLMKTASEDLIAALLPILDDFDRAKAVADNPDTSETMSEGVMLVYNKLYSVLGNKGLKPMESTGEAFDPELHEGITEKIIRYAKVVIGK